MAEFRYVESVEELRVNLNRLPDLCTQDSDFWRRLFREHTYWLFDPDTENFGPNKWAAFWQMSTADYKNCVRLTKEKQRAPTVHPFHGEKAREHIESDDICGCKYEKNEELKGKLFDWADRMVGQGAMQGLKRPSKFLVLIQDSATQEISLPDWTPPPETSSTITRTIRDSATTRRLKRLYNYRCMVCNTRLGRSGDEGYAECGHVRPLGRPHEGPDEPENIVVLCPNHHVMLDAGLLGIDPDTHEVRLAPSAEPKHRRRTRLRFQNGHKLRREHLEYHAKEIFNRQSRRG